MAVLIVFVTDTITGSSVSEGFGSSCLILVRKGWRGASGIGAFEHPTKHIVVAISTRKTPSRRHISVLVIFALSQRENSLALRRNRQYETETSSRRRAK